MDVTNLLLYYRGHCEYKVSSTYSTYIVNDQVLLRHYESRSVTLYGHRKPIPVNQLIWDQDEGQ